VSDRLEGKPASVKAARLRSAFLGRLIILGHTSQNGLIRALDQMSVPANSTRMPAPSRARTTAAASGWIFVATARQAW